MQGLRPRECEGAEMKLPAHIDALAERLMETQTNARGAIELLWREEIAPLVEQLQALCDDWNKHVTPEWTKTNDEVRNRHRLHQKARAALARLERTT
jgi:hypothetical protein